MYVGDTEQRLRFRAEVRDDEVELWLLPRCSTSGAHYYAGDRVLSLEGRTFVAPLRDDGAFEIGDEFTLGGTDGDETRVDLNIRGRARGDVVDGQFTIEADFFNGQSNAVDGTCAAKKVNFETSGVYQQVTRVVEVPVREADLLVPDGHGMWILDERLDANLSNMAERLVWVALDGGVLADLELEPDPFGGGMNAYRGTVAPDAGDGVWVGGRESSFEALVRYDVSTGDVTARRRGHATAMANAHGALWAVMLLPGTGSPAKASLEKLDPSSGAASSTVPLPGYGRVVGSTDGLWVVTDSNEVLRIDPATMASLSSVRLSYAPRSVAAGEAGLWLVGERDDVTQILPDGTKGETVEVPSWVGGIAVDATGAWVSSPQEKVLRRIESGRLVKTVDVEEAVVHLAFDSEGRLWGTTPTAVLAYDLSDE